jgi:8-oxo-dGTP pyrophosphatase MutT (NUDIX family)
MNEPVNDWPALRAATAADAGARLPFFVLDGGQALEAGSVARAHLPALRRWPRELRQDDSGLTLAVPAAERDAWFDAHNPVLRDEGLIVAWRNERYPVQALADRRLLATFERAASRFWGTLTFGAHCNGWVAGADGRPQSLWIARRALTKPTDPGLLDNLVGGGVPHGQSADETVVREGWEEAGLTPAQMAARTRGRLYRVARDIPEGFQLEWLQVFDLALPAGLVPRNQDGEVGELLCLPVAEALARAGSGQMTVDASLATLDFALRQALLPPADLVRLATLAAALQLPGQLP